MLRLNQSHFTTDHFYINMDLCQHLYFWSFDVLFDYKQTKSWLSEYETLIIKFR